MEVDDRLIWLCPEDFEAIMDAISDDSVPKCELVDLLRGYTFISGSAQKPTWPEIKSREIYSSNSPNVKNTPA